MRYFAPALLAASAIAADYYTCAQIPFCERYRFFESNQLNVTFTQPQVVSESENTTLTEKFWDFLLDINTEFHNLQQRVDRRVKQFRKLSADDSL